MHRNRRKFPLIPDGEACIQAPVIMRLYDNEDLITNIRGDYQEKDYNDILPDYDFISDNVNTAQVPKDRMTSRDAGISYAQRARNEAKRDVREKRQKFLQQEIQPGSHSANRSLFQKRKAINAGIRAETKTPISKPKAVTTAHQPVTAEALEKPLNRLSSKKDKVAHQHSNIHHLADRLQQDSYILAELPKTYQKPQNPSRKDIKKNSYDFLKHSQIYDYEERQLNQERQVAQELNLTRFEDAN
ncbi:hypothetical protein [Streptococcus dentiloxodontae]